MASWLDELTSVTSVHGRRGNVTAELGDYNSDQIANASSVVGATVSDALVTIANFASDNADDIAALGSPDKSTSVLLVNVSATTHTPLTISGLEDVEAVLLNLAGSATINLITIPSAGRYTGPRLFRVSGTGTLQFNNLYGDAGQLDLGNFASLTLAQGDEFYLQLRSPDTWLVTPCISRSLRFASELPLSTTNPTSNQVLRYSVASGIGGVDPGLLLPTVTAANFAGSSISYNANKNLIWTGGLTPTFSFSASPSPTDTATVRLFFPAGSINSIAFSGSVMDPTGDLADGFVDNTKAHMLLSTYFATGPCIMSTFRVVGV